jgi:hypothetical protein
MNGLSPNFEQVLNQASALPVKEIEMDFIKKEQQIIQLGRYYFEIDAEAGTYSYRGVQLAGGALTGYSQRRDAAIELMGYRATEPRDADKLLRAVGDDLYAEEAKENYQRINLNPDKTWSIDYLASRLADEIEWAIECLPKRPETLGLDDEDELDNARSSLDHARDISKEVYAMSRVMPHEIGE